MLQPPLFYYSFLSVDIRADGDWYDLKHVEIVLGIRALNFNIIWRPLIGLGTFTPQHYPHDLCQISGYVALFSGAWQTVRYPAWNSLGGKAEGSC